MSSELIVINTKEYLNCGWKRYDSYRFAAETTTVQLLIAEMAAAMQHYPLAFEKDTEGKFRLIALQGLHKGKNLFVNDAGLWMGSYTPSAFRSYPFLFKQMTDGVKTQEVLCLDNKESLFRSIPDKKKGEERFFDDNGKPTEVLNKLLFFLDQSKKNRILTNAAVANLVKYNLLEEWDIKDNDEEKDSVEGLYKINQKNLQILEAEDLKKLQESNALSVAYAQIFSMPLIGMLKRLSNITNEEKKKVMKTDSINDISSFFGEDGGETIKFNF